jgi:hypothetical protein
MCPSSATLRMTGLPVSLSVANDRQAGCEIIFNENILCLYIEMQ